MPLSPSANAVPEGARHWAPAGVDPAPSRKAVFLAWFSAVLLVPCAASGADPAAEKRDSQQAQRRLESEFAASAGEDERGAIESLRRGGAYASLDFPDRLKMLAGKLGQGGRDAALARLEALKEQMATPAASAALGQAYLSLGDAASAREMAEGVLRASKFDSEMLSPELQADGHSLKAYALLMVNDRDGASAAADMALRLNPRHSGANSLVRLNGRGSRPASASGTGRVEGGQRPGGELRREGHDRARTFLRRLEQAFGKRDRSVTLDGTIRKAGKGNAVSFADMERAGIKFEEGGAEQKDAIEVREDEGKVVVSVSPSVLKSAKDARVAAQFGRGLEEATVERDYDGIGEFIRKVGGRVKAVKILIELDVNDKEPKPGGEEKADMKLLADRAVVEADNAFPRFFPVDLLRSMVSILEKARSSTDSSPVGVMIESVKVDSITPAPSSRSAQEEGYLTNLRNSR